METLTQSELSVLRYQVLTVPMRNGNSMLLILLLLHFLSSYRTYEEWKPKRRRCRTDRHIRSYRTYEEWKLIHFAVLLCEVFVLTVPMRNGNMRARRNIRRLVSSYRTYEEWKQYDKYIAKYDVLKFLPYL